MFKVQDGEQIIHTMVISTDDFEELLECKIRLNILLGVIESNDIQHIKSFGDKSSYLDADEAKLILGYVENENLVKRLTSEYQSKKEQEKKEPADE